MLKLKINYRKDDFVAVVVAGLQVFDVVIVFILLFCVLHLNILK